MEVQHPGGQVIYCKLCIHRYQSSCRTGGLKHDPIDGEYRTYVSCHDRNKNFDCSGFKKQSWLQRLFNHSNDRGEA
jgi:hypothetical protein